MIHDVAVVRCPQSIRTQKGAICEGVGKSGRFGVRVLVLVLIVTRKVENQESTIIEINKLIQHCNIQNINTRYTSTRNTDKSNGHGQETKYAVSDGLFAASFNSTPQSGRLGWNSEKSQRRRLAPNARSS